MLESRVLIVDDDREIARAIGLRLSNVGFKPIIAFDGQQGLTIAQSDPPDAIVLDLRMPVMDGFELLQHCMKLPESHRPTRVIAISGEYEAGALRGQPVAFLPKPFELNSLLEMLGGKMN